MNKWGHKLTDQELNERIREIESRYPKHQHIDLDKDYYYPADRNLLIKYYKLQYERNHAQYEKRK